MRGCWGGAFGERKGEGPVRDGSKKVKTKDTGLFGWGGGLRNFKWPQTKAITATAVGGRQNSKNHCCVQKKRRPVRAKEA